MFLCWILLYAPLFTENLVVWWLPTTTIAAAIIITYFVICPGSLGSRFVGLGFLVFIGNLSYTVYLIHFPIYLAIQQNQTGWAYWPNEAVPAGRHLHHRHRQLVPDRAPAHAMARPVSGPRWVRQLNRVRR